MKFFSPALRGELLKLIKTNGKAKNFLSFVREYNLKKKLLSETSWFIISNLIYSSSTYIVGILIPYILDTDYMAYFTSGNQILFLLAFIFEFGLSVSFLRFYKLDKSTKYLNSLFQFFIFFVLIVIGFFFGDTINSLFNLDELPVDPFLLYFLVISQLAWVFIKNWFLAINNLKVLLFHSILILLLRILFVIHLFIIKEFTISQLFIETLFLPFSITLGHLIIINIKIISEVFPEIKKLKIISLEKATRKVFDFLQFSALTYLAGLLYLYTGRYLVIYLTGKNNIILADLGYSMTFIGILLVFYTSFRNYLISRLDKNNMDFIKSYITNLKSFNWYFVVGGVITSILLSYIIFLIKPSYLTFNTVIYAFILFVTRFYLIYIGMFTVLSKTMDYNKIEIVLNIIRLIIVILITHFIIDDYTIAGIILIFTSQIFIEMIFARIVMKRINHYVQVQHNQIIY